MPALVLSPAIVLRGANARSLARRLCLLLGSVHRRLFLSEYLASTSRMVVQLTISSATWPTHPGGISTTCPLALSLTGTRTSLCGRDSGLSELSGADW